MGSEDTQVQQIVLRLQGLALTVQSSGQGVQVVVDSRPEGPEQPAASPRLVTEEAEPPGQAEPISELAPTTLRRLSRSLCSVGSLAPEGRILRAFEAGRAAKLVLEGQHDRVPPTPHLALKNAYYVVLRCPSHGPFWARRWATAQRQVGPALGESVLHGWPTQAEAEAYCLGAGLAGLPIEL